MMAKLIYTGITSLDGFVNDVDGKFDWSVPDEEVHAFVNDLEREIGTYLYGRRLYETMVAWEHFDLEDAPRVVRDYANLWRAAEKIVFSSSLAAVDSARTRLVREFDPEIVRELTATADSPLSIGGPALATHAIRAGLVDEFHQFVFPVVVGGGTRYLPEGTKRDLELLDERRFGNGVVHLHYRNGTRA